MLYVGSSGAEAPGWAAAELHDKKLGHGGVAASRCTCGAMVHQGSPQCAEVARWVVGCTVKGSRAAARTLFTMGGVIDGGVRPSKGATVGWRRKRRPKSMV